MIRAPAFMFVAVHFDTLDLQSRASVIYEDGDLVPLCIPVEVVAPLCQYGILQFASVERYAINDPRAIRYAYWLKYACRSGVVMRKFRVDEMKILAGMAEQQAATLFPNHPYNPLFSYELNVKPCADSVLSKLRSGESYIRLSISSGDSSVHCKLLQIGQPITATIPLFIVQDLLKRKLLTTTTVINPTGGEVIHCGPVEGVLLLFQAVPENGVVLKTKGVGDIPESVADLRDLLDVLEAPEYRKYVGAIAKASLQEALRTIWNGKCPITSFSGPIVQLTRRYFPAKQYAVMAKRATAKR